MARSQQPIRVKLNVALVECALRPLGVVPLGWPAKQLGPPRRAPVAEKTFRERYGTLWS